jgi:hypothetical protein
VDQNGLAAGAERPNEPRWMPGRGPVLDALLASIAGDLAGAACLDLTADAVAASALGARDQACAIDAEPAMAYGLVVCEARTFARGMHSLDPLGSMLVFFRRNESTDVAAPHEVVARVRCPEGQWWLVRRRAAEAPPEPPAVSILVVVQDQVRELAALVGALVDMHAEPTWELVVVDRGSFDATGELLRHVSGDLQAFRAPRDTSFTHAVWLGLLRARGELIAVLDPDLIPHPGLVAGLRRGADQFPDADVFAGPLQSTSDDPPHMLAVRRRIVHVEGDASPNGLAARLGKVKPTLVPAFTARRA